MKKSTVRANELDAKLQWKHFKFQKIKDINGKLVEICYVSADIETKNGDQVVDGLERVQFVIVAPYAGYVKRWRDLTCSHSRLSQNAPMSPEHENRVCKTFVWQYCMNEKKFRKHFSQNSSGQQNVTFFYRILADFHVKIDYFSIFLMNFVENVSEVCFS